MVSAGLFSSINSWSEFTAALNPLSEKEKGDAFELLVAAFLRTHPTYRSLLRTVWLLAEVPDDIRRELNLPAPDEGIDLVARTFSGEYWAIQAKYRSDVQSSLTHSELSTFTSLAFVICRGISFGLICTTTERVTDLLEGNRRIGFRTSDTWQHLPADIFEAARAGRELIARIPKPTTPWPHQLRALDNRKATRPTLEMIVPTSRGQTSPFLDAAFRRDLRT